jgi:ribosomal protein L29
MDERERLQRELFETRQELARKRILAGRGPPDLLDRLGYVPERDEDFLRLAGMNAEELQAHIERLKRDLADLEEGFD